jgi:hypothetical protein
MIFYEETFLCTLQQGHRMGIDRKAEELAKEE